MRIAFFGGSFDPPHCGHLAIAQAAKERLALDQVWMAPAGAQPLKSLAEASSYADRLAMVKLAVDDYAGFQASDVDAPRADGRPNYTIDVLKRIKLNLHEDDALFLLLGADSMVSLRSWYRAGELLFCGNVVVAGRPGFRLDNLAGVLPEGVQEVLVRDTAESPGLTEWELRNGAGERSKLFLMADLHEDVSATRIRAALAGQGSADGVLSPAVLRYIRAKRLYR